MMRTLKETTEQIGQALMFFTHLVRKKTQLFLFDSEGAMTFLQNKDCVSVPCKQEKCRSEVLCELLLPSGKFEASISEKRQDHIRFLLFCQGTTKYTLDVRRCNGIILSRFGVTKHSILRWLSVYCQTSVTSVIFRRFLVKIGRFLLFFRGTTKNWYIRTSIGIFCRDSL